MSKSSNRKKRRKEKRRKELARLRGASSLVDSATPTPKLEGSSPVPDRSLYGNLPSQSSQASSADLPTASSPSGHPQHEEEKKEADAAAAKPQQSPSHHSVMDIPLDGPKAPTWKRVEFVFPGSNKQPFLFAQQHDDEKRKEANAAASKEKEAASNGKKEKKKNESIEDILFSDKKRQRTEEKKEPDSVQNAEKAALDGIQNNNNDTSRKKEETPLSAPRLRKLESTFERVHRESFDEKETMDASNFVDLPQHHSKKAKKEKKHMASIPENGHGKKDEKETDISRHDKKRPPQQEAPLAHPPKRGKVSGRSVEEAVQDKRGLRPRANSTDGELSLPQGGLCDEQMVLEKYRWHHEAQRAPRGFHNLGNTCYLNSTLQCLAHVPPFCQTLAAISEKSMKRRKDGQLYKGQRVTTYLSTLFRQAHGLNNNSAQKRGPLAPRDVVNALPLIGSCGSKGGYKFRPGRQEDAHEFLVHLLDAMNDGELRASGINQHASGWRDRLPVTRLDETTLIHRIFGGYFRSQVRCPRCSYRSNTYDPFLDLSLEISKKSSSSVLQALSQFTRKETLDSDNQWRCDGCKKYVCPTKQLTVFRPPLALCIQLKRFAFNGGSPFGGFGYNGFSKFGGGGSKISKPVEFPAKLSLPLSDNRTCAYTLTGIVIHVGGSASSGHYTSCVKRPGRAGSPPQWYHVDDEVVEPVSEKYVLRQKDAYLLFYSRKEVKIEFPTPPPRSMSAAEATEFGRIRARARAESISRDDANETAKKPAAVAVLKKKEAVQTKTNSHSLATPIRAGQSLGVAAASSSSDSSTSSSTSQSSSSEAQHTKKSSQTNKNAIKESPSENNSSGVSSKDESEKKPAPAAVPKAKQDSSDSSDSDSSSDDSSEDEEEKGGGKTSAYFGEPKITPQPKKVEKARVVVDSSDSRGKVKVKVGPKKRKAWESKATALPSKEKSFQLLGNMKVSRWDEDVSDEDDTAALLPKANGDRQKIVNKIAKQDSARKRKMHLDRWDSHLDQGRQKKVKSATKNTPETESSADPKKNRFHQMQSSVQRMVRGKPKGHYPNKKNGKKNNKPPRSFGFRQGFGKY